MVRVRHVASKAELERLVDEYVVLGFNVKDMGDSSAKVKKVESGSALQHILVYLVGGLFTAGFGLIFPVFNAILFGAKRLAGEEIVIKVEK